MIKVMSALKRIDPKILLQLCKYLGELDFAAVRTLLAVFLVRFSPEPAFKPVIFPGTDALEDLPVFTSVAEPVVSIVIPVYNHYTQTISCLKSLHAAGTLCRYEIILANDCSDDETRSISDSATNLRILSNAENLQFLRNCNNAATTARGKYLLFLNNDTNVQTGWLDSLLATAESDRSIGIVGPKLVYPNGRLQEAGGIVWNDGSCWNYGWFDDPQKEEYNYTREVDYVSGACLLIRRDLWEKVGGFDERFAPAYYEDTDLAFQARQFGYKVMYQPKSVVVHFEGISSGTDLKSGVKHNQLANKKKFFAKWQTVLQKEHFERGRNLIAASDRNAYRSK
jgi:GT2 family glycosyltransferase